MHQRIDPSTKRRKISINQISKESIHQPTNLIKKKQSINQRISQSTKRKMINQVIK